MVPQASVPPHEAQLRRNLGFLHPAPCTPRPPTPQRAGRSRLSNSCDAGVQFGQERRPFVSVLPTAPKTQERPYPVVWVGSPGQSSKAPNGPSLALSCCQGNGIAHSQIHFLRPSSDQFFLPPALRKETQPGFQPREQAWLDSQQRARDPQRPPNPWASPGRTAALPPGIGG